MPRSRSRGGWQMRGGRCVTNSTRPAMEAAGADQGLSVNNLVNSVYAKCILSSYLSAVMGINIL